MYCICARRNAKALKDLIHFLFLTRPHLIRLIGPLPQAAAVGSTADHEHVAEAYRNSLNFYGWNL